MKIYSINNNYDKPIKQYKQKTSHTLQSMPIKKISDISFKSYYNIGHVKQITPEEKQSMEYLTSSQDITKELALKLRKLPVKTLQAIPKDSFCVLNKMDNKQIETAIKHNFFTENGPLIKNPRSIPIFADLTTRQFEVFGNIPDKIKQSSPELTYAILTAQSGCVPYCSPILNNEQIENLTPEISKLTKEIWSGINTRVSDKQVQDLDNFFALLNDENQIQLIEKINVNEIPTGIPLKYPRKKLIADINKVLSQMDEKDRFIIINNMSIHPVNVATEGKKTIKGYNGILYSENLSDYDKPEIEIKKYIEKFLYNNGIQTNRKNNLFSKLFKNDSVNKFYNTVFKAFPELLNMVGKVQHKTHSMTVDAHTIKVLQSAIKHPLYKTLNKEDKMVLKMAILFHDIGKNEGIIDSNHIYSSANITANILKRIPQLTYEQKNRIVNLIKNHSWLEKLNNEKATSKQTALQLKHSSDLKLAEIIATSDLKGVNDWFYDKYSKSIKPAVKSVQTEIDKIYQTGSLLFTSSLNTDLIPTFKDKHNFSVKYLDLDKVGNDEDLTKYGFSVSKKDDLQLFTIQDNLEERPFQFYDILDGNYVHGQFGKLKDLKKPKDYQYNYLVEVSKENVKLTGLPSNLQNRKLFEYNLMDDIFNVASDRKKYRSNFRKVFLNNLKNINTNYELTNEEYGTICKQLSNIKSYDEIQNIRFHNKRIKKEELIQALNKTQNDILSNKESNGVTLYAPRIKAILVNEAPTLEDVRQSLLLGVPIIKTKMQG